jgi:hypothetical protein
MGQVPFALGLTIYSRGCAPGRQGIQLELEGSFKEVVRWALRRMRPLGWKWFGYRLHTLVSHLVGNQGRVMESGLQLGTAEKGRRGPTAVQVKGTAWEGALGVREEVKPGYHDGVIKPRGWWNEPMAVRTVLRAGTETSARRSSR